MTKWVGHQFLAETDEHDPLKFIVRAPVGMKVVAVAAQGQTPSILALIDPTAPIVEHPFLIAIPGSPMEVMLGKSLGDCWPVQIEGPQGQPVLVVIAQELPWPVAKKFMLETA